MSIEHSEVYTQKGDLRKNPPKQYICQSCGHKQNGRAANKIKLPGITFLNCGKCYGKIIENPSCQAWWDERDRRIIEERKQSKVTAETFKKAYGGNHS